MSADGDIVITTVPNRKGWWLALIVNNTVQPMAKFRSEVAVDAFTAWIERTPGLVFVDRTGFKEGPVQGG